MVTIDDLMKLDLRIAEVIEAQEHPNADKLVVLQIAVGDEKRQIVAGIKKHYDCASLVGKKIVIIANLEPATLRGVESQGMLLAASSGEDVVLLTVDKDVVSGARVK